MPAADPIQPLVDELLNSRKYRALNLPAETVRDLLEQELPRHRSGKDALKAVRHKLHTIVAPYLGDPDYDQVAVDLRAASTAGPEALRAACAEVLAAHASTRERLITLRKNCPAVADGLLQGMDTGSSRVLGYLRVHTGGQALVLANFSEQEQVIPANLLRLYGLSYHFTDLVTGAELPPGDLTLDAFQFVCLIGE